jgi:hypothetical protein
VGRGAADVRPSQAGARLGVAQSAGRQRAGKGRGASPRDTLTRNRVHHSHGATRPELAPSAARRRHRPAGRPPAPSRRRVVARFNPDQASRGPGGFATAAYWRFRSNGRTRPASCSWQFTRAALAPRTR